MVEVKEKMQLKAESKKLKVEGKSTEKPKKAVNKSEKAGDLLSKYQTHKEDTGSTEVQVVILTKKITELTKHLKEHRHDFDSRVGLLKMVGKRRRLLNYFKKTDEVRYAGLIADLKLRK
ncbi:MAG: 30S ribosomal protein S15 [Candidatus Berkelbacteria bacterium Athens1014_28]|uniref:Small ribosomal subunit protein uS15 n=1 Tax=Candidatus Berkelbacteria bacterium Athens1014_28 TaxID=2017145 RepID=A0A554LLY2_9BACT|nr:MAG: 30S ribosomal protein S15 [Candidatus Berkelbacteria bacterium Athens1014_28]